MRTKAAPRRFQEQFDSREQEGFYRDILADTLEQDGEIDDHETRIAALETELDTPRWNDINFPGLNFSVGAASPPSLSLSYGSGRIAHRHFNGSATLNECWSGDEILHGYVEGTDIHLHIHWMPVDANSGNVKWQLEYSWQNVGDVGSPTTISVVTAAGGTAWKHQFAEFPVVPGAGKTINGQFSFRLFRNPSDAQDTYNSAAALLSVGLHYQVDRIGSKEIGTK